METATIDPIVMEHANSLTEIRHEVERLGRVLKLARQCEFADLVYKIEEQLCFGLGALDLVAEHADARLRGAIEDIIAQIEEICR